MGFHHQSVSSQPTTTPSAATDAQAQSTVFRPSSQQVLQVEMVRSLQQLLAQEKQQLAIQRSEDFGFEWEELSPSAAILHDPLQRNGWSHTGYLGFPTKRAAMTKLRALRRRLALSSSGDSPQTQLHLRKARRLTTHRWEIKATDIAPELLM